MENKNEKKAYNTPRAEYVEVAPNVRLHVTDAGKGRPIVMIHGWPLSDEMFEYQYKALVNKSFRAIGISLRGFGKSDKPYGAYDYDVHASDIKIVLDKLDVKDAVLLGFSMGGAIALRYVSKYNGAHVSKLVLCGAAVPLWTQRPDFKYNFLVSDVDELIKLNDKDRPQLLDNFAKIFSASEDALSSGIGAWLNAIGLSASSYAKAECLVALRDTDLRADMLKVTVPTLIMHGRNDKICSFDLAKQMKLGLKNSEIIVFEKSGHSMFLEEIDRFNSELIKFAKK